MDAPLIVTLQLNEASFAYFNQLRQQLFPPERNFLQAHLTLFHHLPSTNAAIENELLDISHHQQAIELSINDVVSIGKGVAFKIESQVLLALHKQLQLKWKDWLIPQDKQKLWPHVTVQNKVSPSTAKKTLLQLQKNFQPFQAKGIGFQLWHYENGPWSFIRSIPFVH